jgi:hypothetical protein
MQHIYELDSFTTEITPDGRVILVIDDDTPSPIPEFNFD